MNIEGQVIMRYGLEEKAKQINRDAIKKGLPTVRLIPRVAGDGVLGIENQVKQFYSLIKKKVDLIIVQPTDNAALTAPLKLANKKNIPVVSYDQFILGGKQVSFITSNNYQAGKLNAEYIASKFKNNYEIKLVLVEYPNVSSTIDRVDGFFDTLKKLNQKYKIIGTYKAVEPTSGIKAGGDILRDFPKKGSIDVIFTINDGGGLSIVDALSKAGRNEIMIATVDGDPLSVKNIKDKNLTVIDSAQFCAELGRQSILAAYSFLNGKKVSNKILVPSYPITNETIKNYSGWKAKIPPPFKKPWFPYDDWDNSIK
ncbi:MAG: ribose transport system substrate-binding protein [Bacteriovoracaceae bacterium]|jgi:ribose transport system substrate-binding protein